MGVMLRLSKHGGQGLCARPFDGAQGDKPSLPNMISFFSTSYLKIQQLS
jgi:hypothetical protein